MGAGAEEEEGQQDHDREEEGQAETFLDGATLGNPQACAQAAHDGGEAIHGAVNAVAPHPATNREFTRVYARVLGRKAWFPVPAFLLKRLPGGMGRLFLDSQRVEPAVMKAFGFEWRYPDLESALRSLED